MELTRGALKVNKEMPKLAALAEKQFLDADAKIAHDFGSLFMGARKVLCLLHIFVNLNPDFVS
jgi:hypothetical protein